MKIRLFTLLIGFLHFSVIAQCDLAITEFNFTTGDIVVEVINSENCGCNDLTDIETDCNTSNSPVIQNNETISHIVLGLHLDGLDYNWGCTTGTFHPGWTFKVISFSGNSVLETGDIWTSNIYDYGTNSNDCWTEILANNEECAELAIWQINLSQTSFVEDGGWAVNPSVANNTQNYPDFNVWNNSTLQCPPPDAPDAIIGNVEIETGCIGDLPVYNITYTVWNIGQDTITDYCVEIWNEDYYICFDGDLFGNYEIPPGEGQVFQTPFWEGGSPGNLFVISVDNVNDEIITGNNNTTVFFPEWPECPIECESDTIIEYINITDTLYINTIDTLYIELPPDTIYVTLPPDTLIIVETEYITEYIYDTTYVDVIIDNYIYITDTITEYTTEYIDCITGLPCEDNPGMGECYPWTVYIPNTFTPNNDGLNDTWQIMYDLECWLNIEFWVFNRWGNEIYHNYGNFYDSYPYWDGSVNDGGYYAPDGVYYYIVNAQKYNSPVILKKTGTITLFR